MKNPTLIPLKDELVIVENTPLAANRGAGHYVFQNKMYEFPSCHSINYPVLASTIKREGLGLLDKAQVEQKYKEAEAEKMAEENSKGVGGGYSISFQQTFFELGHKFGFIAGYTHPSKGEFTREQMIEFAEDLIINLVKNRKSIGELFTYYLYAKKFTDEYLSSLATIKKCGVEIQMEEQDEWSNESGAFITSQPKVGADGFIIVTKIIL